MKYTELKKYLDESDKKHSLGRLLSNYIVKAAIVLAFLLVGISLFTKLDANLVWLDVSMFTIGMGGKSLSKKYEKLGVEK